MKHKVLVVGGEGRAHALGWKIAQSPRVEKVYFAPGNGGTSEVGENVDIGVDEHDKLADFADKHKIDLTVVSPEQPLVGGIVDLFESRGLKIFGPTKAAARIEASKAFSTEFFRKYKIPHPESFVAKSYEEAKDYIKNHEFDSYVIKADGLAAGKGVIVPNSEDEAQTALLDIMHNKVFGEAGSQVVFQERLRGQEVSAFAISDGRNSVMLPFFQDHKQIFDGDKGPNTGGVGAYTPLPFMDEKLAKRIETEIIRPTVAGMAAEGSPFKGALYGGLFITEQGEPKVIEFNCRFGDPETEPMVRILDEDLYPLLLASAEGDLKGNQVKTKPGAAVTIVLCSGGYPGDYETGKEVLGLDIDSPDVVVFHAGTKKQAGKVVTSGGRVLNVTAYGKDLKSALKLAYDHIGEAGIHFAGMHYRKDIGFRVLGG